MTIDIVARGLASRIGDSAQRLCTTRSELAALQQRNRAWLSEAGRDGAFAWRSGDFSALVGTDTAQGLHVPAQGDAGGGTGVWQRIVGPLAQLEWFGAAGNGTSDDGPALQKALDTCAALYPKGFVLTSEAGRTFRIATAVALPANCTIRGISFSCSGSIDLFTVQKTLTAEQALTSFYENIFIEDCIFTADVQGNEKNVLVATNVRKLGFRRNRCYRIGGLFTRHGISAAGLTANVTFSSTHDGIDDTGLSFVDPYTGAAIPGGDPDVGLNEDIWFQDNIMIGSGPYMFACRIGYTRKFFVTGNYCMFAHLSWIGGSAPRDEGGWAGAFRRVRHGVYMGNYVEGVNGGIYGQKGEHILVQGNMLKNITDTAIDFEGCINCSAISNIIENAGNFCLSTFYMSRNIVFEGNLCRQDGTGALISDVLYGGASKGKISPQAGNIFFAMRVGDSSFWTENDVTVRNNTFEWLGATGTGVHSVGYCKNFVFEGNRHLNVQANLQTTPRWSAKVRGNRFRFTQAPAATGQNLLAVSAHEAMRGECIDNEIELDGVAMPADTQAIYCQIGTTNGGRMIVRGNRVKRINGATIARQLVLRGAPTNLAQTARFYCENNIVEDITDQSAPGQAMIYMAGNRTDIGVPVPALSAMPSSFNFAKHSRVEADSPVAGGTIFQQATADGTVMPASAAFAAGTEYALDANFFSSTGNIYRVTIAGTAGTAEPTGTATSIANGTMTVRYMGKLASWLVAAAGSPESPSSATSGATLTPDASAYATFARTAQAAALTIAAPINPLFDGQTIRFRLRDNGTARTIAWNAAYRPIGVVLPTTTVVGKTTYVTALYNAAEAVWDVILSATQP